MTNAASQAAVHAAETASPQSLLVAMQKLSHSRSPGRHRRRDSARYGRQILTATAVATAVAAAAAQAVLAAAAAAAAFESEVARRVGSTSDRDGAGLA
jgi:hypothetical protein